MHNIKNLLAPTIKNIIPARLVVFQLPTNPKNVLLTFDDGPDPCITPEVLNLLDKYNAKALFFIIGYKIGKAQELIREIIARGHEVGNHTFSHANNLSYLQIKDDIRKCQDLLYKTTGKIPKFYRPPYGRIDICAILAAKQIGLSLVHFSAEVGEYSSERTLSPEQLGHNMLRRIKSGDILLAHDDKESIPRALGIMLPRLAEMDFDLCRGLSFLKQLVS